MTEATRGERVKCRQIMTANVTTATREMTLRDVARLLREGDMGSVPVVEGGRLVGIVTDRDIVVRAIAEGKGPKASMLALGYAGVVGADEFEPMAAIRRLIDKLSGCELRGRVTLVPVVNEAAFRLGQRTADDGCCSDTICVPSGSTRSENWASTRRSYRGMRVGPEACLDDGGGAPWPRNFNAMKLYAAVASIGAPNR